MAESKLVTVLRNPLLPLIWALQWIQSFCARRFGLEIRFTKAGHTIVFLPLLAYNFCAFIFSPLNYLINNICYLQPNGQPEWDSPALQPPLKERVSDDRIAQIRKQLLAKEIETFGEHEIVQLFDTLKPATRVDLIGKSYRGHIVRCGCFLDLVDKVLVRPLMTLGFVWGKRYRSQHVGDPLLMCWKEKIFFPFPIWGNVGMTGIQWRGEHQATMNYDHQPWQDFFRILDDGQHSGNRVYLGVWSAREKTGGWFTLTLRRDVETI